MRFTTPPRWRRGARRSERESVADIKPRRRLKVADLRWVAAAIGALLLVQVLRTPDLRLHFVTGASLTQGALISAIALGVVLTYRGSGVVNFATGAIAMYAAYVYTGLRTDGILFLPPLPNPLALIEGAVHLLDDGSDFQLPHWPTEISFGGPLTFPAALGLSLVFCVLMGLALHFLVFRPLRTAPPLAKVVASVGVLLLLQAIIVHRFGTAARATLLGHGAPKQVELPFSIRMNTEQLLVITAVIVFAFALWALFRFTRFGVATRAAAENEKGAMLLGFSPDFLAGTNWVLSTVIAGLLGILVAGNQKSVDPLTITLLIIPALSVALVGGLTSFGLTVAAAFAIAMTQALVPFLGASRSWYPQTGGQALPGVAALLPFLLIVGVMFFNGRALPTRGSVSSGRLPKVANPTLFSTRVVAPVAVAGCALTLMFLATPNGRLAIITSLIGIVISLSFVVIAGYVGQISLAQMMLAGISGFALSKLTTAGIHLFGHTVIPRLPFPISPLVGALGAMVVGVLVALPALRVRGVSLAIVTFAFAVAMEEFLFQNPAVNGGFAGAKINSPGPLDPLKTASVGRGSGANVWFGMFCLGVVVALCAMVVNLRRSATGRRFLATRSNERAAAAAGVDVTRTKLTAFALAAFIAGIAGALVGYRLGGVNQLYFGGTQSLTVFAFAYLGGIAGVSGAVAAGSLMPGGIVFTILQTVFKIPPEFTLILGGLAVIATAILNPEGVAGGLTARAETARRAHPGAPSDGSDRRHAAVGRQPMTALLETYGLTITFGGVRAIDHLDLRIEHGLLVGVIGPNGAGKTTAIDGITGFVPTTGRIMFEGQSINALPAYRRSRAGLGRTWQSVELFEDLTIAENLMVAAESPSWKDVVLDLVWPRRRSDHGAVERALVALGIDDLRDRMPTEISQGQRKLVGVARALAAAPKLICMDEPAAGLDTAESAVLGDRLRQIVDTGVTILLVDHDMNLVLNVCDYIYVIEFGSLIAAGTPAEVARDPHVIEAYLGASRTDERP